MSVSKSKYSDLHTDSGVVQDGHRQSQLLDPSCPTPFLTVSCTPGKSTIVPPNTHLTWELVGNGEQPVGCGEYRMTPSLFCETDRVAFRVRQRCHQKTCPECGELWTKKESRRASEYLIFNRVPHTRVRRWFISPPQNLDLSDPDVYDKVRARVTEILRDNGWVGGYTVPHPCRDTDGDKEFDIPGFHFQGFGLKRYDPGTPRIPEGWIYKTISQRGSLRKRVGYDLDHAGVTQSKSSITWWGCVSYNQSHVLMSSLTVVLSPSHCPICGGELRRLTWRESCTQLDWIERILPDSESSEHRDRG